MGVLVDDDEATALASDLIECAQDSPKLVAHDDGVVHSAYLVRDDGRLHQPREPWVWYDIAREDSPRTEYDDAKAPEDLRPHEAHSVRHQDAPTVTYHGWVQGAGGYVLLGSDGTSWTPVAFVPDD